MSDEKVIVSVNEAMYAQGPAGGKDGPGAPPPYTETVKPYVASTMIVGQSVDVDRKPRGCFGAFVWLMATWPIVLAILIPVIAILIIATVRFPEYPAFIEGNRAR